MYTVFYCTLWTNCVHCPLSIVSSPKYIHKYLYIYCVYILQERQWTMDTVGPQCAIENCIYYPSLLDLIQWILYTKLHLPLGHIIIYPNLDIVISRHSFSVRP